MFFRFLPKTILAAVLVLLPCYASADAIEIVDQGKTVAAPGQVRIVKCTQGLAAVQELVVDPFYDGLDWRNVKVWRTLPGGCMPLAAAELLYEEETAWRNRPPAPTVIEPVQVIAP